ncbi:MAG: hypothetical protein V1906_02520, partial [Candidatus Woesearchaeota archaeon]
SMLRVMFDTTIYGFIAKESKEKREAIVRLIKSDNDLRIYGFREIRREIRNVKKWIDSRLTNSILEIYDLIIAKQYETSLKIESLALQYFQEYSRLGGKKRFDDLEVDFLIVSCATLKNIDILYSGDRESMSTNSKFCKICQEAYTNVNLKEKLRCPNFYRYCELKKLIGIYKK